MSLNRSAVNVHALNAEVVSSSVIADYRPVTVADHSMKRIAVLGLSTGCVSIVDDSSLRIRLS